jgi:hypothetical protein
MNADPVAMAERIPERASHSQEIIDLFRKLVRRENFNLPAAKKLLSSVD